MSDPVERLLVTLGMDSSEFTRGAKRAADDMSAMRKGMTSAAAAVKGAIGGMVAAMAVDRVAQLAAAGLEYASSLGETATQLGVTTRALQEYRYAASQAGVEQGEMDQALSQLTRRLGDAANGTGEAGKALERLGINLRDANGQVIDAGDAIPLIAEALRGIPSPAERAALLVDLFGKSGQKLAPLMAEGAAGVNSLRDAAHKMGLVLSDGQIQKADEAADKMAALKKVLEARIAGAVAENADTILEMVTALTQLSVAAVNAAVAVKKFFGQERALRNAAMSGTRNKMSWGDEAHKEWRDAVWGDIAPSQNNRPSAAGRRRAAAVEQNRRAKSYISGSGAPVPAIRSGGLFSPSSRASGAGGGLAGSLSGAEAVAATLDELNRASFAAQSGLARLSDQFVAAQTSVRGLLADTGTLAGSGFPALEKASARVSDEMQRLRDAAGAILDRLFPDVAEVRRFDEEMAILDKALKNGAISDGTHARAVRALRQEYSGLADIMADMTEIVTLLDQPTLEEQARAGMDKLTDEWSRAGDTMGTVNVRVVESFAQMVDGSLSHLDRFITGIKSGNWLDTVGGLLSLIDSIAGIMTQGQGTSVGPFQFGNRSGGGAGVPGFATGGSLRLGGLPGVDTNLLALNGQPIARVSANETLTVSPPGRGGGGEVAVRVIKGDLFDVVVERKAAGAVAAAAPALIDAGASAAIARSMRMQRARLD